MPIYTIKETVDIYDPILKLKEQYAINEFHIDIKTVWNRIKDAIFKILKVFVAGLRAIGKFFAYVPRAISKLVKNNKLYTGAEKPLESFEDTEEWQNFIKGLNLDEVPLMNLTYSHIEQLNASTDCWISIRNCLHKYISRTFEYWFKHDLKTYYSDERADGVKIPEVLLFLNESLNKEIDNAFNYVYFNDPSRYESGRFDQLDLFKKYFFDEACVGEDNRKIAGKSILMKNGNFKSENQMTELLDKFSKKAATAERDLEINIAMIYKDINRYTVPDASEEDLDIIFDIMQL